MPGDGVGLVDFVMSADSRDFAEIEAAFGPHARRWVRDGEASGELLVDRAVEDLRGPVRELWDLRAGDTVLPRRPPRWVRRKTLLYRSRAALGGYAVNHVEGCRHGCRYPCYALSMKRRFGRIGSYAEWLTPRVAMNAPEILSAELDRLPSDAVENVTLCLTTDPFPYREPAVAEVTLQLIGVLNRRAIPVTILTKGVLPPGLPARAAGGRSNRYGISLVCLDENFRRRYEPFTAPYAERVAALRRAHEAGAPTWACVEPYPPSTLFAQDLEGVLDAVGFVGEVFLGRWNYGGPETRGPVPSREWNEILGRAFEVCRRRGIRCRHRLGSKDGGGGSAAVPEGGRTD